MIIRVFRKDGRPLASKSTIMIPMTNPLVPQRSMGKIMKTLPKIAMICRSVRRVVSQPQAKRLVQTGMRWLRRDGLPAKISSHCTSRARL